MSDKYLVYLQSSGCTQNDLKKICIPKEGYDPISLWERVKSKDSTIDISEGRREKIFEKAMTLDTESIDRVLSEKSIEIVSWYDTLYPELLRKVDHAPFFLFVRGNLRSDIPHVGVVGSRKNTPYAKRILEKIIPDLTRSSVGIISGGALGVDTLGHIIALDHGGYTIAVLGTGIDRAYPATNKSLFERIIKEGGAVVSHFPLGTGPEVYNFPIRNEIVAGLSRGVIIPEAALSSGTLITAQLALEYGRDVFAIPGDIDRTTSEGTNMLIASGQAKCVRCAADILEEYFDIQAMGDGMTPIIKEVPKFDDEKQEKIYTLIISGIKSVDDLQKGSEYEMSDLLMLLSLMEIDGYIGLDIMGKYEIR